MLEEFKNLLMERSKKIISEDFEKEKKLDKKIKEISKKLTKQDVELLLKGSSNYAEKIYWQNRLNKFNL